MKEAISRSLDLVEKKNPGLENKEEVAKMVGVGAVIFHDLFNQRIKNIDFSWEEVLNFEGTTGPYVQYTYARAKSILRKSGIESDVEGSIKIRTQDEVKITDWCSTKDAHQCYAKFLIDDSSYQLAKKLAEYSDAVNEAAERYEPSAIARYVMGIAVLFNKFYHECNIMNAEKNTKNARLLLVKLTCDVIKSACDLLGMHCPEKM